MQRYPVTFPVLSTIVAQNDFFPLGHVGPVTGCWNATAFGILLKLAPGPVKSAPTIAIAVRHVVANFFKRKTRILAVVPSRE